MEGLILLAALGLAALGLAWVLRRRHHAPALPAPAAPVPTPPQHAWLDAAQQARWQCQVQRFLADKRFIGCAGFALDATHAARIAGIACLLRVQQGAEDQPLFPTVREVLVYPDAFLVPPVRELVSEDGLELVDDTPDVRIGEHGPGQVVLSWADVEAALAGDAIHVVIHEFAHALDSENPETEGAPTLADYGEWSAVMQAEFVRLRRHRRPPVLDPYGAQSPAEFWCVVAEAFFQQPAALARHHPTLHALLCRYFEISPPIGGDLAAAPTTA